MKDLFNLLIFKKLYPETDHRTRIVDACTGVVTWTCIAIAIHFTVKAIML